MRSEFVRKPLKCAKTNSNVEGNDHAATVLSRMALSDVLFFSALLYCISLLVWMRVANPFDSACIVLRYLMVSVHDSYSI